MADFIWSCLTFPTSPQCHAFGLWTDILPVHSSYGDKEWFNAFLGLMKLRESHISLNAIYSTRAVASCLACRRGHPPIDLLDLPKIKLKINCNMLKTRNFWCCTFQIKRSDAKRKRKRERGKEQESHSGHQKYVVYISYLCMYVYVDLYIGSKPSSIPGSFASLASIRVLLSPGP